jgi:hypothetical protein
MEDKTDFTSNSLPGKVKKLLFHPGSLLAIFWIRASKSGLESFLICKGSLK